MNLKKHLPWLGALLPIINAQADTNPNVVIIYIDDMGIGDIGCYGGKFVATPNIDKLAQDGLLFNQYYSSAPVSSPSRCGLTTGLFPIEVGINTFLNDKASNKRCEQRNYLDDKLPSMARAFQNAGYATGHIGKWHMGGGRDVYNAPSIKNYGFDEYLSTYESPDPDPAITASKWIWCDNDSVKRWKRTEYFVDKSIDFIKRHKDSPFFLNLWPDDMHTPWVPEFKQKERKSWETKEAFSLVLGEMDKQIGRFIKALDDMGLSENTIIIFTSDNGPAPSFKAVRSAYLRGTKNSLYEGGIRIPFIARWPGHVPAGTVNDHICAFYDLMPTFCEIIGEKNYVKKYTNKNKEVDYFDGISFAPTLLGKKKQKEHDFLYWEFNETNQIGVRMGDWKIVVKKGVPFLYNLATDIHEDNNVADQHPEIVEKMKTIIFAQHTPNPYFSVTLPEKK